MDKQTKRNEMLTRKTKKNLQNGEIRVNEIFYSSPKKCSILSDSNWENKIYTLKGAQNLACFFFFVSKKVNGQPSKKKETIC